MRSFFSAIVLLLGFAAAAAAQGWGYYGQTWSRPSYGYYIQSPAALSYGYSGAPTYYGPLNHYGSLQNGYSYNPRVAYYGDKSYWSDRRGKPYYNNGFSDTFFGGQYDTGASSGVIIGPMGANATTNLGRAVGPDRPQ
jgi:hypothetical protein